MRKKDNSLFVFLLIVIVSALFIYYATSNTKLENNIQNREVVNTIVENDDEVSGELIIYFLDVGQGDSILIKNNDRYALVDAGNNGDGSYLVDYFKSLGITSFDYVVATHAHEDHIGGMDDIINNFKIDNYYMTDFITTTKTFEDVLNALENNDVSIIVPDVGTEFLMNSAKFRVLSCDGAANDINDTSIVLKLTYGDISVLLTGDASTSVEKKLLDMDIKSDVLKLGHHGSKYSTSINFLDKVAPKYAIVSAGVNNKYNHPHDVTLKKLSDRDIEVFRTDIDGTIKMITNGSVIKFEKIQTNTNG